MTTATTTRLLSAWFVVALSALTLSHCTAARAQEMRFRVPQLSVLITPGEGRVQQQLVQRVRLESNFPFNSLRVALGDVAGAEMVELQAAGTREFKTYANAGWVYETSRALFFGRSGRFDIPAVHVSGTTLLPDGSKPEFTTSSEPVSVDIGAPAAAMLGEPWLVASRVEISEQWSVPPELLRAGQIATRTIRVQAHGVTGEHIADLKMPVSLGASVLPGAVIRRTRTTDDTSIGILEQDFEVRVLSDSKTDISAVQIPWWDAAANSMKRAAVRAYRIEPLPANVEQIVQQIIDQAHQTQLRSARHLMLLIVGSALLIALLLVTLVLFRPVRRWYARIWQNTTNFLIGPAEQLPDIGIALRPQGMPSAASGKRRWHHPAKGEQ